MPEPIPPQPEPNDPPRPSAGPPDADPAGRAARCRVLLERGDVPGFNAERPEGELDLTGIVLAGRVLDGARLDFCILRRATLDDCSLVGASLRAACLERASLRNVTLNEADLGGRTNLRHADFTGARAMRADFSLADLVRADLVDAVFSGSRFNFAMLYDATLAGSTFEGCEFEQANLASSLLDRASFRNANMPHCRLFETTGENVDFRGANLTGAEAMLSRYTGEQVLFEGAFVKGFIHDGFHRRDDLLGNAIRDREPPPGQFPARERPKEEALLIDGIPGTDKVLYDAAMKDLHDLVGMENIKTKVRTLMSVLHNREDRRALGLPELDFMQHQAYMGDPGTGKTTVARIMSRLFAAMGFLSRGQLVETDPDGLIAPYVGQTGERTHKKVAEGLDGTVFIDEAYGIAENKEYGPEAARALLLDMENFRKRLLVIIAGYTDPIERLLRFNTGFRSRFRPANFYYFENYSDGQLVEIMIRTLESKRFVFDREFAATASAMFALGRERLDRALAAGSGIRWANGREVRSALETAWERLANRTSGKGRDRALLTTLRVEDLAFELMTGVPPDAVNLRSLGWTFAADPAKRLTAGDLPVTGGFPDLADDAKRSLFALLPRS